MSCYDLETLRREWREGITRQSRQQVHLSADLETAWQVGRRHGPAAILPVEAGAMARDGCVFWLSDNGVWLCREVPWRYVREDGILYDGEGQKRR